MLLPTYASFTKNAAGLSVGYRPVKLFMAKIVWYYGQ
jgi:hypothetical protein